MCGLRSNAIQRCPGQQAGVLQVAETVGEHPGGDHDQRDRGPGEEHPDVQPDGPAIEQPAQHDGGGYAPGGTEERCGRLARRLGRRPQEQGRLQAFAADREERGHGQRAGAEHGGARYLARQPGGQAGGRPAHPEDHRGDQADREHAEHPAERLLRLAGQRAGGEREYRGEARGQRHRAEHAEPHRRRCPASRRRLTHGGQQDADHQPGLESLAQPDQQIWNTVRPSHATKVRLT